MSKYDWDTVFENDSFPTIVKWINLANYYDCVTMQSILEYVVIRKNSIQKATVLHETNVCDGDCSKYLLPERNNPLPS